MIYERERERDREREGERDWGRGLVIKIEMLAI
jgi:hypothetical protein